MKKSLIKMLIALVAVVIGFYCIFQVDRIDSGQTGIIVNLAGSDRGVDDAKVETGWVVFNRFTKQLFEYTAYARIVDYEPFDIQDKKGTIFTADPTVEYLIERDQAKIVFLRYRKDQDALEKSVLLMEVKNAYKDKSGTYDTDSLINNRPQFEKEVEDLLRERLTAKGFKLSGLQSNVKPNDRLQTAIDDKNAAIQVALKVENEKKSAEYEADKVRTTAQGKADANKILQQSITPELLKLKAIEKWDGSMPKVVSSGTIPFIDIK